MEKGTWQATVHGSQRVGHDQVISTAQTATGPLSIVVLVQSISSKSVSKKILRKYVNFESNSSYHFTDKIKMIT